MSKTLKFVLMMALGFAFIVVVPAAAKADLPKEVPPECQVYVDERNDYLMAVIRNFQQALDYEKSQVTMWREAHDRVAANAVARNYEYAAEVEKNRKLTDKLRHKNFVIAQLRERLRK